MATTTDTRTGHLPGTPAYRRLNVAMVLVGLAAFGILYATQPILPQLGDEYGVDAPRASLTVSAATGALALLVIPATAIGLRIGRVRTIRWGLLAAVALTMVAAAAPTFGLLVAARGLAGAALAGVVAVAMGHVAAEVHPSGLAGAMGLYVAGNSLGGVSGRLVTSAAADLGGWRVALAVLGVVAAVVTALVWRFTEDTGPAPDAAPALTADGGTAVRPGVLALLREPSVVAVLLLPFVLMGGFVATYNYLSFRLAAVPFDLPAAVVGLVFLAYLAGTVSSAVAGRAAQRYGRARVLALGVVVMGLGLALTLPDRLPLVVAGLVVLTAGFFAAHAVASGWAPVLGAAAPARASALYVAMYYAGSSLFGALVGLAWHAGGWDATAASVGVLVTLALLLVGVAARTRRG